MPDLTEAQKSELPRNVITRALGMQDHVVIDLQHDDPKLGDVYVLCSDGLSGMVGDNDIRDIVIGSLSTDDACQRLIAEANDHGGEDNITAVVVTFEEAEDSPKRRNADHDEAERSPGVMNASGATHRSLDRLRRSS
jgi:protein phosphatase